MTKKQETVALITDIADAIREVTGTTDTLTLAQMPDAILNAKPPTDKALEDIDAAWGTDAIWATIAKYGDVVRETPAAFAKYVGQTLTYTHSSYGAQTLRVVDIAHYDRSDGKGKAAFTFDHVATPTTREMNDSNTTSGGYPASAMKSFLEGDFYSGMPTVVKNALAPVTIPCSLTAGVTPTETPNCTLFLLSEMEVFGTYQYVSEGTQLAWYAANNTDAARVKKYSGSAGVWWLRSPYGDISFCVVRADGSQYYSKAATARGVSPAFCIG